MASLVELCQRAMAKLVNAADAQKRKELLSLPMDLLENIISLLSPFALESLQNEAGCKYWFTQNCGRSHGKHRHGVKRHFDEMIRASSLCCLNGAWKHHLDNRWPSGLRKVRYNNTLSPSEVELLDLQEIDASLDWRRAFWEAHVQECLNEAVTLASTSPLEPLSNMKLPSHLMQAIGCDLANSEAETLKFCSLKYNCQHFGPHARYLRLRGILCTKELSDLLSSCMELQHVACSHVDTAIQVEGLCLFLRRIRERLCVLEFQHCRFSENGLRRIHESLTMDETGLCMLQHLFVQSSRSLVQQATAATIFIRFLHACRHMRSLVLIDNQVSLVTASDLLTAISSGLLKLTLFHLKENELEGFAGLSFQKMLQTRNLTPLKALDFRSNNIGERDIKEFLPYLKCVPLLEQLNFSDNPLGDEGVMALIPLLPGLQLAELSFSACDISTVSACHLLDLLTSLKRPLRSLDISHNNLGRPMAAPLAKFLQHGGVERLHIGDIQLGSGGCSDLKDALQEMPNLTHLILRKNRLGSAVAGLLCKLMTTSNFIKEIDFSSNLLDLQCLQSVASQLQLQSTVKGGVLELVDLRYNLAEGFELFTNIEKPKVLLSEVGGSIYDDEP